MMMRQIFKVLFLVLLTGFSLPQKEITVFTAGDSTMSYYSPQSLKETSGSDNYPLRGWMMAMADFFNDELVIKNYAVSGRSSKSFRAQGHWNRIMKEIKPGDYVFIQFGHNDQKKSDTTRYAEARTDFKQNMRNYVLETKQRRARPILFTSIPVRRFDSTGLLIDRHGDYVKVIRELAKETNTPLIDLNMSASKLLSTLGPDASKKLFMHIEPGEFPRLPDGLKDDTHLNIEGAKQIAALVAQEIKKQRIRPLAKYLN